MKDEENLALSSSFVPSSVSLRVFAHPLVHFSVGGLPTELAAQSLAYVVLLAARNFFKRAVITRRVFVNSVERRCVRGHRM